MRFGAWFDREKRERGLRQAKVAADLGIRQPQLSGYLSGKQVPRPDRRAAIENYTNGEVKADRDWGGPEAAPARGRFVAHPTEPHRILYIKP